jgi:hypothetical protein
MLSGFCVGERDTLFSLFLMFTPLLFLVMCTNSSVSIYKIFFINIQELRKIVFKLNLSMIFFFQNYPSIIKKENIDILLFFHLIINIFMKI